MITLPFTRATFASEMKPKISGANLTLEYDNLESPLSKVAIEMGDLLSPALYGKICDKTAASGDTAETLNNEAIDYLQRAMLHFAIFEQTIYLITRISNDGITVKKNDDETTVFKYLQDELNDKLIEDAWFWFNRLVTLIEGNADKFADWAEAPKKKELATLPITVADFTKWVGVSSHYFVLQATWIIREVWTECVLSRSKQPSKTDDLARATCYEVMARATRQLPFHALPKTIRFEVNNEMKKTNGDKSEGHVRETIATHFTARADAFWKSLDIKTQANTTSDIASQEAYKPSKLTETDSFAY
jgi:hypothetical protein